MSFLNFHLALRQMMPRVQPVLVLLVQGIYGFLTLECVQSSFPVPNLSLPFRQKSTPLRLALVLLRQRIYDFLALDRVESRVKEQDDVRLLDERKDDPAGRWWEL
jgi:hypothetical protein